MEAVQRRALKTVLGLKPLAFGPQVPPYHDRLNQLSLQTLQDRTEKRFCDFTLANENFVNFQKYLRRRQEVGVVRRNATPYLLPTPRTERYKKSPFYVMATLLNNSATQARADGQS